MHPVKYYPAFLNLSDKKVVVAGGGKIAERKVLALLHAGASVTVISPSLTRQLRKEKEMKRIAHISRRYRRGDLKGSFLVIAATDSAEVNSLVAKDAPSLVNVVDVPAECNFIVPSVIKRGPLTVAVSTGGISPALSRSIRKELEEIYGRDFAAYLAALKKIRAAVLRRIPDKKSRERLLKSLASPDVIRTLRSKGAVLAIQAAMKKAAPYLD